MKTFQVLHCTKYTSFWNINIYQNKLFCCLMVFCPGMPLTIYVQSIWNTILNFNNHIYSWLSPLEEVEKTNTLYKQGAQLCPNTKLLLPTLHHTVQKTKHWFHKIIHKHTATQRASFRNTTGPIFNQCRDRQWYKFT